MEIINQTIQKQEILIKEPSSLRESEISDSNVIIKIRAKNFWAWHVCFNHCVFNIQKPWHNYRWYDNYLDSCTFTGKFSGNDFGHRADKAGIYWQKGGIINCDFSQAILAGSRFVNCDLATILLPTWPCFTILNPVENLHILQKINWPGKMNVLFMFKGDDFPSKVVGWTEYVPDLIKRLGGTEEELYEIISKLDFVRI